MSFRVTAGVWLGTVCGLSLANKFLFFKECEAETGQAAKGLFPQAAGENRGRISVPASHSRGNL